MTDRQYTHQAENQLVTDFLDHPQLTHLFLTESDMILPHDAIIKLLALDKDMASGVYFLRSPKPEHRGQPCLYKRPTMSSVNRNGDIDYGHLPVTIFPTETPFQVDVAGLGCVLIKRHVFEELPEPWFDLSAKNYGSDMYFYTHARRKGFELWIDPTVRCGQIDYYQVGIEDWQWQVENNPTFLGQGYIVGTNGYVTPDS